jgi:hypothetical protein
VFYGKVNSAIVKGLNTVLQQDIHFFLI